MQTATPYHLALTPLSNIYLEDSYVLNIIENSDLISFEMEFVLTEKHELYQAPKPYEQYCYRRGAINFIECENTVLVLSGQPPSKDVTGETDLGNIDVFIDFEGKYFVEGNWGRLETSCKEVTVKFKSESHTP